ncbi:MAG: glutamate-cysteine ligase family protein [Desulfobacterales bacterium]
MSDTALHLFEAIGLELEYMIVDRRSLSVLPIADKVLAAVAGQIVSEVEVGALSWSNELVLHVIELKTNGPAGSLTGLGKEFERHVEKINAILRPMGGRLIPTACHPWMNPLTETVLWPHDYSPVYEAYDRIFGCRGHGWSNLQSTHINLPFNGDGEFAALHAAIRLLLPIMPALTASSPVLDGKPTGFLDSRMEVYRHNSALIPSVAGRIVPEPVYSCGDYERDIFQPMFAAIAPYDPAGVLQHEFLNSRGAIARFDRGAIEIRVLDVQECPQADTAIAALLAVVLKKLCREHWGPVEKIKNIATNLLADLFLAVIKDGDATIIDNQEFLETVGLAGRGPQTTRQIWRHLFESCLTDGDIDAETVRPVETILEKGCLARRILKALGKNARREKLHRVYADLCDCLADGRMYLV